MVLCPRNGRGEIAICPSDCRSCGRSHGQSVAVASFSVHGLSMTASAPAACQGAVRAPAVNQLCPDAAQAGECPQCGNHRLRHFPRESLIARLSSGEASIVKVEVAGHYGETDLDDAQRATQSKGDSRGAGVNPARMRTGRTRIVRGHGLDADIRGLATVTDMV